MNWKSLQKRLHLLNWVILLILSSTKCSAHELFFCRGRALGGLIAITNFQVLQHTIRGAFLPEGQHEERASFQSLSNPICACLALGVIIYILIDKSLVDPIGLAVGCRPSCSVCQPWPLAW